MLINGISNDNRIRYIIGNCEKLPIKNNVYDRITIAFGLRNITNRQLALDEIYRVLKPGGRFICLEFSMVNDTIVKKFYDLWSFNVIPKLGKIITNNEDAYKYLIESIRMFPDQDQLSSMFIKSKFERVKYRNLSKGIASLHSVWKF